MKLENYQFEPVYFKTRHEIYAEFYKPCMENSIKYDRVSGYFGSSIFIVIKDALKTFIKNNGKIRIICSPILSREDYEAIIYGYENRKEGKITSNINSIFDEMYNQFPSETRLLSKLISEGFLEIKLAIFGDQNLQANRLFHDKVGLFTDSYGQSVAFRGSVNETYMGVSSFGNSESFDVDRSWGENIEKIRVNLAQNQFEKIWAGSETGVQTFNVSETSMQKLKSLYTDRNFEELIQEITIKHKVTSPKTEKWFAEVGPNARVIKPHQEEILNNWEKHHYQGIFKMCTGAGKTFTALCAIRKLVFNLKKTAVILVPSTLLFEQWEIELKKTFDNDLFICRCGAGHSPKTEQIKQYSMKLEMAKIILSTYSFASSDKFLRSIIQGEHIFLIADEVHNIGSQVNSRILTLLTGPRIGLSATPERYFDEQGTKMIIEYFNGIIPPEYDIGRAIREKVLSRYYYYTNEVQLTLDEQDEWNKLTKQINQKILINKSKKIDNLSEVPGLELLLFRRADIIKKASFKIDISCQILEREFKVGHRWLVYLDDTNHVRELLTRLRKNHLFEDRVFEYHTNTDGNLDDTISEFRQFGGILLSINCLDEGVDIPEIDHAIILSSSKNPRQYIQRRGRVLRTHKDKNFAYIYDFLVSSNELEKDELKGLSIIRSEIARAIEFAKNAKNDSYAMATIEAIMISNGIEIKEGEYGLNE